MVGAVMEADTMVAYKRLYVSLYIWIDKYSVKQQVRKEKQHQGDK